MFFPNPDTDPPSFKHDTTQLPVEVQVKIAPSECLVEEHRNRPEEELTCSVTPEVSDSQDVKVREFVKAVN